MFLKGDLKDCVKLNIENIVGDCQGSYPESLIKIRHDLAEKDKLGTWKDGIIFDIIDHIDS